MNQNQTVPYQPYQKFQVTFITQFIKGENFYLVAQSYGRAAHELVDHTKTPILFTPYKNTSDAVAHFEYLRNKGDNKAAYVDIRKGNITAKLVDMCYGLSDTAAYLSLVTNLQQTNNYLAKHYRESIRSWVKRKREWWNIREHNSLQPSLVTIHGEPWVKIVWGSHIIMASLDDLERF